MMAGLNKAFLSVLMAILFLIFPSLAFAQKAKLSAALIDNSVLVTSSFSGAKVTIFGSVAVAQGQASDIIVIVRGPDRPSWVTKKYKILGLWLGRERMYFDAAPTYFGRASTREIDKIISPSIRTTYAIDPLSQIQIASKSENLKNQHELINAFINERKKQKLYIDASDGVKTYTGGLFRADIKMPDLTPPGLYTVKVILLANGVPVDTTLSTFVVTKVGFERTIYEFSKDFQLIYALLGVALACFVGFISAKIFGRFSNS